MTYEKGKSVLRLLGEFEGKKTITYTGTFLLGHVVEIINGDFDMENNRVTTTKFSLLCKRLGKMCTENGSCLIIMRQFTSDTDTVTGFPIKNLYVWAVKNGCVMRMNKKDVEDSMNMDSSTGERLEKEESVVYC
jgi:hypothetical protein